MYQLLESIKCDKGHLENLSYHQARVDQSVKDLYPNCKPPDLMQIKVPTNLKGIHKCRFLYDHSGHEYHFLPYHLPKVRTLLCVVSNSISYSHKYINRFEIDRLATGADEQEILIIRNGVVTDSSFANVAFYDGLNWYTPTDYLLQGTKRQFLADQGQLIEKQIKVDEIHDFQKVSLINALLDLDEISLPTDRIILT